MNKYTFFIPFRFKGLNEIIALCKKSPYSYNKYKKEVENYCGYCIKAKRTFVKPVKITYNWIEPNKKRDLDNIFSAKKFINDALVAARVIKDDSQRYLQEIRDNLIIEKGKSGVEVVVEEIQ